MKIHKSMERSFGAMFAFCILAAAPASYAEVFTLGTGSTLDLAGTLSLNLLFTSPFSATLSGTGTITPATPGSLHTDLVGTLNATAAGGVLNFTGGSAIGFANPDALAFDINVPLTGGPPGLSLSLQVHGKIHDAIFDVTGSAPLTGPAGNQTFDTAGLNLVTTAGVFDGTFAACTPTCGTPTTFTQSIADPSNPDTLPTGVGTLVVNGGKPTISFPLDITDTVSHTETVTTQGITADTTTTLNGALTGRITASVPEPSAWVLVLVGLAALPLARRRLF